MGISFFQIKITPFKSFLPNAEHFVLFGVRDFVKKWLGAFSEFVAQGLPIFTLYKIQGINDKDDEFTVALQYNF